MRRALLPVVVVVAVAAVAAAAPAWLPRPELGATAGRVAALVVVLLAARFGRVRAAWAAALLGLAGEGLTRLPAARPDLLGLVAVLAAADLAVVAWLGERRLASPAGVAGFAVLAAQAALVAAAAGGRLAGLLAAMATPLALPAPAATLLAGRATPPVGLVALAAGALAVAAAAAARRRGGEGGLLAALAALALALEGEEASWLLAAGGVALAVGVVEDAASLAFEDALTGLPARRALEERLRQLGRRYAVAMIDLDRFKQLNDRNGHEVGDQVLRMVAARLATVGGGGTAFRYGGEEFTVVFPGRSADEARPHLEDLRRRVADRRFAVRAPGRPKKDARAAAAGRGAAAAGTRELKVTVSIGLADADGRRRPEDVVKAADKALYRAKKAGRNRVAG